MPIHPSTRPAPLSFTAVVIAYVSQQQLVTVQQTSICLPSLELLQDCADRCYAAYSAQCENITAIERAALRLRTIKQGVAQHPQLMTQHEAVSVAAWAIVQQVDQCRQKRAARRRVLAR